MSYKKPQKSLVTRQVILFKKNRIYAVNTTEYQVELVISQEPHTYEIIDKKLVVKGITHLKFKGHDLVRHEISIDGIKAYHLKKDEPLTVVDQTVQSRVMLFEQKILEQKILEQNRLQQNDNLKRILKDYPPKDFLQSKRIGAGSFGVVYLGYLNDTELVAVKQFQIIANASDDRYFRHLGTFFDEINILRGLDHPNIVKYKYACVHSQNKIPTHLNIFLEYCSGGSLADLIPSNQLSESKVSKYTKQILSAIKYLHEKGVIHRDIKGSNILLDDSGNIKLADFGCSKYFEGMSVSSTVTGTQDFIAPEVVNGEYGRLSDIWSLGCTVIQMITSKTPQISQILVTKGNLNLGIPHIPSTLSDDLKDFLNLSLKVNPKERSTAAQLLNHRFIINHNS